MHSVTTIHVRSHSLIWLSREPQETYPACVFYFSLQNMLKMFYRCDKYLNGLGAQVFRGACFVIMHTELSTVCQVPSAFLLTRMVPRSNKYGIRIMWSLYV
jgi:hypothetical protein